MRRTGRCAAALALALLAAPAAVGEIRVRDDAGRELALAQPAARIVSLAPNVTELLFVIGAGERIVGADEYSDYPAAARAIPRVNNHAAANYERILALAPDLVIGWQSGNGEILGRLRQLGAPVFEIEPRRLEDLPGLLQRFGELTGSEARATQLQREFAGRLEGLRAATRGKRRVRVFYEVWHEPLITLNGRHLVSDVITLCGGTNVFADAAPLVPYVGIEAVLAADPEVIVSSGGDERGSDALAAWSAWPSIRAVRERQVHSIPSDLMERHSMRILDGAAMLCAYLEGARALP